MTRGAEDGGRVASVGTWGRGELGGGCSGSRDSWMGAVEVHVGEICRVYGDVIRSVVRRAS